MGPKGLAPQARAPAPMVRPPDSPVPDTAPSGDAAGTGAEGEDHPPARDPEMGIRIDRVYTRTGDDGSTHLALGGRVPKDSPRIEACGALDELNAWIGLAREELKGLPQERAGLAAGLDPLFLRIQQKLFDLGAYIAMGPGTYQEGMPSVSPEDVRLLEEEMDRWQKDLAPLTGFVLPGGGRPSAVLHLCRTACRRAERRAIRLHRDTPLQKPAVPFLNRLSDWLFVAGRYAAKEMGVPEVLWRSAPRKS